MNRLNLLIVPALLVLSGCAIASAAVNVATAPVRAGSKVVDAVTTSQAEQDQKRGKEIRRREQRLGELDREYVKQSRKCSAGDRGACDKAARSQAEMQALLPSVPYEAN